MYHISKEFTAYIFIDFIINQSCFSFSLICVNLSQNPLVEYIELGVLSVSLVKSVFYPSPKLVALAPPLTIFYLISYV